MLLVCMQQRVLECTQPVKKTRLLPSPVKTLRQRLCVTRTIETSAQIIACYVHVQKESMLHSLCVAHCVHVFALQSLYTFPLSQALSLKQKRHRIRYQIVHISQAKNAGHELHTVPAQAIVSFNSKMIEALCYGEAQSSSYEHARTCTILNYSVCVPSHTCTRKFARTHVQEQINVHKQDNRQHKFLLKAQRLSRTRAHACTDR